MSLFYYFVMNDHSQQNKSMTYCSFCVCCVYKFFIFSFHFSCICCFDGSLDEVNVDRFTSCLSCPKKKNTSKNRKLMNKSDERKYKLIKNNSR